MERRLAAILAADVVDYTRLMGQDQAGTLDVLRQLRRELFEPLVSEYKGTIVKRLGDGWIVEFASVSDAVECALRVHNGLADHEIIRMRTGIHIGDVVFEDEDVFGDGVNVAARLEELAAPGEVLISDTAHQSLDGKTAAQFGDGKIHQLKNVARSVQVWRWPAVAATEAASAPSIDDASAPSIDDVSLPVPDKPSIAVLPFDNMSGDPEQEYFADGIAEDIITALSKIRWLFVIARNSSFSYKGTSPDVRQIAGELGVRYVLEGSVRKGGDRIRITAQLIDATTGSHVWAERYDRDLGDIFALQDEITETLIAAIEPELAKAEQQRAIHKNPENLDAWSWFQRGLWHHYRSTKEDNAEAQVLIRKAIELDPEFSRALAVLAHVLYWDVLFGYTETPKEALNEGLELSRRAISADDMEPFAHFALGRISTLRGDLDTAVAELKLSIELSPSFAHAYYGLGHALNMSGLPEQAILQMDRSIRLNPHDPSIWTFMGGRAIAHILLKQYDEALTWSLKSVRQANAGWLVHVILACVFGHLGRFDEAHGAAADTLQLKPDFAISFISDTFPFQVSAHRKLFLEGLRKAGFPE